MAELTLPLRSWGRKISSCLQYLQ